MPGIKEQFSFQTLSKHFEQDTHIDVQHLEIDSIHLLHGETAQEDVLVVLYEASPNISFYDANGRLIDVDHYLPSNYRTQDTSGAQSVIANLRSTNADLFKTKDSYHDLLSSTFAMGGNKLALGLRKMIGLQTTASAVEQFRSYHRFAGSEDDFINFLKNRYDTFYQFLEEFILVQQQSGNGYVHITDHDNIIITPLNKRSGMAVIIETQDINGRLLPPNRWVITRTNENAKFEQALVFRTEDVKAFFEADGYEQTFETDRYKLYRRSDEIAIDSLLDNTDNMLELPLINNCYQILASDKNIIVVLSSKKEVSIINTHHSVVPHKWPRKIVLPELTECVRVDENLCLLFAQNNLGDVIVYDITTEHPTEIQRFGIYAKGFEVDQKGHLVFKSSGSNQLVKIKTNVTDLELPSDQQNIGSVLKSLAHLFKGESLFSQKEYAKVVTKEKVEEQQKMPSSFDAARYDFETNIEHMLATAGNDYEKLLAIQNKIAIARQNLAEELTAYAEKEEMLLVGQRLQMAINSIIRPAENKVRNMIEATRAETILRETQIFKGKIATLSDPSAYREILNTTRKFEEELRIMLPENSASIYTDFKAIQQELNATFSDQIANDGTVLQKFIAGEIEQIETAIKNTHEPRQLEILLSTHPAALELMTLLKQPFVLQHIAKEQKLSPAGIQSRLFQSLETRKKELKAEADRLEAEQNKAKLQLANMIQESIDFFVSNHSGGFSDLELSSNSSHRQINSDILKIENQFKDVRLAMELRRKLERRILERNREDLEKLVAFEGKYAYIQNDHDLYIDLESTIRSFPNWDLELIEKRGEAKAYMVSFIRSTDKAVYRPSTTENLRAGKAFELTEDDYQNFFESYENYISNENTFELLTALWAIHQGEAKSADYPQFSVDRLLALRPKDSTATKALRCALEKKNREQLERTRERYVPKISPEFIDETPYFQEKLREFIIKAKLQLATGSGIILLSGPPSTGKSAFLQFVASILNREYFEHAADKWQTKNSLVTAIKFGEHGPYATPAGFTRAITTPNSLINIEEIKEWPEALRKSLNPFFAGSKNFIAPDGTSYEIGDNILLCAAANLGSMYRQDDEPFTADFWSRIEVVEYNYAPGSVSRDYFNALHLPTKSHFLTMQDLTRSYFNCDQAPGGAEQKATYYSQQFLDFILLPKADEKIKRATIQKHVQEYFINGGNLSGEAFGPEESAKVALRRLKDFQGYTPLEFFDLYDHFTNEQALRSSRLAQLQSGDVEKYEQLRILTLALCNIEGCLRSLRELFHASAGQTEIEGTNREFIKCVHLLGLLGKL